MEKRQDRLEWEMSVLKERYDHMNDRIGEMSIRMDQQHRSYWQPLAASKTTGRGQKVQHRQRFAWHNVTATE